MNWWYIHYLQEPVRTKILERCSRELSQCASECQALKTEKHIVLEEVMNTYPDRIENAFNTYYRVKAFKTFLSEYLSANPDPSH